MTSQGRAHRVVPKNTVPLPSYRPLSRTLTPREEEVYALIVSKGMRYADIAQLIGVGVETVRRHVQNILTKTGASSSLELTVWHYTKER